MSKDTKKDNADRSGVSTREASKAEHQARDDAEKSGYFERGKGNTDKWDEPSKSHQDARDTFVEVFENAQNDEDS